MKQRMQMIFINVAVLLIGIVIGYQYYAYRERSQLLAFAEQAQEATAKFFGPPVLSSNSKKD